MITVTGAQRYARALRRFGEDLGRSSESLLRQEARALCTAFGAVTEPGGFEEAKAAAVRKTVAKDIRRVFASRANISAVCEFAKRRSFPLAMAFYRAAQAGKNAKAARYLAEAGITTEQIDAALHRAARTAPKAHVPKKTVYQAVVKSSSLESYIRGKQELVGFAKAGWYAAALSLGGRVRRNLVAEDGKRRTEEIFPAYIRKIARRFQGLGGSLVMKDRIEVWTNVRHAREAMEPANQDRAMSIARENFTAAMAKAMRALREKHFPRSKAA